MGIYNLGGGGGAPVLEARTVTPSTSQQIIKPSRDEYDGLSQVTVEATPLETRTVNSSTSSQTITPSGSNIGFSTVTVNPYRLQSKIIDAKTAVAPIQSPSDAISIVKPDSNYNGLSQVTVNGVSLETKSVGASGTSHTLYPTSPYKGFGYVTVDPRLTLLYTLSSKTLNPNTLVSAVINRISDFESYLELTFGSYINLDTDVLLINALLQESNGAQFVVTGAWIPSWEADGVIGNGYSWAQSATNNPITKTVNAVANTTTLKLGIGMQSYGQSILDAGVTVLTLKNGNLS